MRPHLQFLSRETIERVITEAYDLLSNPGVRVHSERALRLLAEHGAEVDLDAQVARIPADLARSAVETAPSSFHLYDAAGAPAPVLDYYYGTLAGFNDPQLVEECRAVFRRVLGEGNIDFEPIFRSIKEIGYDGWVSTDEESGSEVLEAMETCMAFMKEGLS